MRTEGAPAKRTQRISAQNFTLDSADKIVNSMLGPRRGSDSVIGMRPAAPSITVPTRGISSAVHTSYRSGEAERSMPHNPSPSFFSSQVHQPANPLLTRLLPSADQPPATWPTAAAGEMRSSGRWESAQTGPWSQMASPVLQQRDWNVSRPEQWQSAPFSQSMAMGQWQPRYIEQPSHGLWPSHRPDPMMGLSPWANGQTNVPMHSSWEPEQITHSGHQIITPQAQRSSFNTGQPVYSSNVFYTSPVSRTSAPLPVGYADPYQQYPSGMRNSGASAANQQHQSVSYGQTSPYQSFQPSPSANSNFPASQPESNSPATNSSYAHMQAAPMTQPRNEAPPHTLSSYLKNIFAIQETDEERFSGQSDSAQKPLPVHFAPANAMSPSSVLQPATASLVLNTRPEQTLESLVLPLITEAPAPHATGFETARNFDLQASTVSQDSRRANSAQPRPERSSMRKSANKKPKKRVDFTEEHELMDVPKYIKKNAAPQPAPQPVTYRPAPSQNYSSYVPSVRYGGASTAQWQTPISAYNSTTPVASRTVYSGQSDGRVSATGGYIYARR